jgi:hypothetical protein
MFDPSEIVHAVWKLQTKVRVCAPRLPNALFEIFRSSLTLVFIYCKYKSVIANLISLQIPQCIKPSILFLIRAHKHHG